MTKPPSAFPLRFKNPALREHVRVLAQHDTITQTDFIEQAVLHEVLLRGQLAVRDLEVAAARLRDLSEGAYEALVARSITEFARREATPDPIAARQAAPTAPEPGPGMTAFAAGRRS